MVAFARMQDFREKKLRGEKIAALTAYDYPTARLLDESEIDVILVGDSLGMVVLGYEDTTSVTLEEMLHHTRAVARGVKRALLVADLPIHTYETPEQALETARLLIDAGAQAVKFEGGATHAAHISAVVNAGIPLMAHIGMLPQSVREEGGYKMKGRTPRGRRAIAQRRGRGGSCGRFCRCARDCGCGNGAANHRELEDPHDRNWFGRALRWADSRYA